MLFHNPMLKRLGENMIINNVFHIFHNEYFRKMFKHTFQHSVEKRTDIHSTLR